MIARDSGDPRGLQARDRGDLPDRREPTASGLERLLRRRGLEARVRESLLQRRGLEARVRGSLLQRRGLEARVRGSLLQRRGVKVRGREKKADSPILRQKSREDEDHSVAAPRLVRPARTSAHPFRSREHPQRGGVTRAGTPLAIA